MDLVLLLSFSFMFFSQMLDCSLADQVDGLSHLQATGTKIPSSPPPCGLSGKFSDQSRSGHMPHLDSQSVLRNLEDVEEASAREEGWHGLLDSDRMLV